MWPGSLAISGVHDYPAASLNQQRQNMPDTVHVSGESDVNGVLPHIERYRGYVCISANIVHREIGGNVE
jgi:hypothetical protein